MANLSIHSFSVYYDGGSVKIGLSRGWSNSTPIQNIIPEDLVGTGISALINSGNFSAAFFLQMAEDTGQAKILAEPNLTTLSGQEAEFLSGGSFWITSPGSAVTPSTPIEVPFGVLLKFIPLVLDSGIINLKVNVSVSEPGPPTLSGGAANTSKLSRGATATVEVPSGQVIAIAGLLNEKARTTANEFPGLGDIPILGALFRSQSFLKEQTELVIFVTPRLANAFPPNQAQVPVGNFVEPDNIDFYLMGKTQGHKPTSSKTNNASPRSNQSSPDKTGSDGYFGHDL